MINVYDPITNEQLEFIEDKPKGMRLYKTAAGDLITCMPESVTIFPSARRIRKPLPFRDVIERPKAEPKPLPRDFHSLAQARTRNEAGIKPFEGVIGGPYIALDFPTG